MTSLRWAPSIAIIGLSLAASIGLTGCSSGGADSGGSSGTGSSTGQDGCGEQDFQLGITPALNDQGVSVGVPPGLDLCRIIVTPEAPEDWYVAIGYDERPALNGGLLRVNDERQCSFTNGTGLADGTTAYEFVCGPDYLDLLAVDEGPDDGAQGLGTWPEAVVEIPDFSAEASEPLNEGENRFAIEYVGAGSLDDGFHTLEAWLHRIVDVDGQVERPGDDRLIARGEVAGLAILVDAQADQAGEGVVGWVVFTEP